MNTLLAKVIWIARSFPKVVNFVFYDFRQVDIEKEETDREKKEEITCNVTPENIFT